MKDSDERAVAYIAGRAPDRWGRFENQSASSPPLLVIPPTIPPPNASASELAAAAEVLRAHPLYTDVTLRLLTEIMNARLFTTVRIFGFITYQSYIICRSSIVWGFIRHGGAFASPASPRTAVSKYPLPLVCHIQVRDALGLTYDVSFELTLFDRLRVGWFVCHVTSTPQKINEALDASLRVLRSFPMQRVTPRELLRARRTLLTRHESELKVICSLQNPCCL